MNLYSKSFCFLLALCFLPPSLFAADNDKDKQYIQHLENELKLLKANYGELENKNDEMIKRHTNNDKAFRNLKSKFEKLQIENDLLKKSKGELNDNLTDAERELKNLKLQIHELKNKIAILEDEKTTRDIQLKHETEGHKLKIFQLGEAQKELNALKNSKPDPFSKPAGSKIDKPKSNLSQGWSTASLGGAFVIGALPSWGWSRLQQDNPIQKDKQKDNKKK